MNFRKYKNFVVVILFLGIATFFLWNQNAFFSKVQNFNKDNIKFLEIAGKKIKIELAIAPSIQERGLSGRESLKEDEGMFFVFPKPGKYFFWMKEMKFPIDIIWINKNFEVIYIQKNALPSSYPETFGPSVDSMYVLEVNAHFSEKNNLKIGENVKILP